MPFSVECTGERPVVKLEGAVTIELAHSLAAALVEVDPQAEVEIDAGALEEIDTAILQLLCSLLKTARGVSFGAPPAVLVEAVDRRGLRRELFRRTEDQ